MTAIARPRRSVLYMPGSNARALEKGRGLAADALILDLEDAVAPDAKTLARTQIVEAVTAGGYGRRELIIRVNALDSAWGKDDIAAVATCLARIRGWWSGSLRTLVYKADSPCLHTQRG